MPVKSVFSYSLFTLLAACLFCGDENKPGPSGPDSTSVEAFGIFRVMLKAEDVESNNPAYTSVHGIMYDGPMPMDILFEETMREGKCRLLKRIFPLCSPSCGSDAKCVQTDSCMPYPSNFSVGDVTVNGFRDEKGGKITFTIKPRVLSIGTSYQMTGVSLSYPPFIEGDTITFAAAGSSAASPFTLKARAIAPLQVITQTAMLEDGKPITLKWVKPSVKGISSIEVRVNISYHGGNKGEIMCECEDEGELTIPANLLDKLKSYGIAGYPVADITRKSVGVDATARAQLVLESTVTVGLTYPGLTSCTGHDDCPEGYHCTDWRLCEPD